MRKNVMTFFVRAFLVFLMCCQLALSCVNTASAHSLTPNTWSPFLPGAELSRYVYSGNDPVNLIDPSGHSYGSNTPGGGPDGINGKSDSCEKRNSCGGSYDVHYDRRGNVDDIIDQNGSYQQNYNDYLNSIQHSGALSPEPAYIAQGREKYLGAVAGSLAARGYVNATTAVEAGTGVTLPKVEMQGSTTRFPTINTPYGPANQSLNYGAMKARAAVNGGASVCRIGTTGRSNTTDAQFWSLQHPNSPGFAKDFGLSAQNIKEPDFVQGGRINPGTQFITREAPGIANNTGGGIEVVVPPNGVKLNFFSKLR
jgi:hypothetical protein